MRDGDIRLGMDERSFAIVFFLLLIIGTVALAVNKIQETNSASPSPTPSGNGLIFNQSSQNPTSQNQQLQAGQVKQFRSFPGILPPDQLKDKMATIQTTKGSIEFELYPEATKAASNFIFLSSRGFYDGLTFHRVESGFVIQGGDPLGTGRGGPGYTFEDELGDSKTYTKGTVAMANSGPNTNGSQFFIMLADHPDLPHSYTIFGKVISGQDVADKIAIGDVMQKVTISNLKTTSP